MDKNAIENKEIEKKAIEKKLLTLVKEFIAEFKSERAASHVTLNASLEKDLGIDSLGRVELFLRIKKAFSVRLSESLLAEADNLQTIVDTLAVAEIVDKSKVIETRQFVSALEETALDPSSANTLVEVLQRHAATEGDRPHIYLMQESGEEKIIRYHDVLTNASKYAVGLLSLGLKPRETVAIMLPTSEEFFYTFFGVLLAGGIPVPIYPPVRADKLEEYAVREAKILNNAEVRILVTFNQAETLSKLLRVFIPSLKTVVLANSLVNSSEKLKLSALSLNGEDPALIQYTSGSTSDPKGVLLTHDNLLANIRSVGKAIGMGPRDVGVSWLPLYHDMGLIGAWFCSLYHGFPLTIMSPLSFLTRPERWLWAIHYHRGTLSAGPNFAYELCVRKIREEDIEGLDLSSWRIAFNGAEAINPRTIERFIAKFSPYGFKPESYFPVYGLAECSVGLAFPPVNRGPKVDIIKRLPFEMEQRAVPAEAQEKDILEFVACGEAIPDHDIRIVNEQDEEVGERKVGSLQFCGPSAMRGYYQNPEATKNVYHDGWWDSGDFAYIADNDVYITGRKKDIIIKAGRNIYPQEIEEVASQVKGVRKGCVAAFGIDDPKWGTEKLIVVAETAETHTTEKDKLNREIVETISTVLGIPPDEVCLVEPRTIPKTSSGKLQRSLCKKIYLEGQLTLKGLPVWLQIGKLFFKGFTVSLKQMLNKTIKILYTIYAALLSLLMLPLVLIALITLTKKLAYKTCHILANVLIGLVCPMRVVNKENLSLYPTMVFVANHASYIDSLILFALLPSNILLVGKKEILNWPLINMAVKKFGFLTVDRMDFQKNIADSQVIIEALKNGHSIVIYPEGTFTYATGLRPFKLGAFKAAVDTKTPLCPIALQGTRRFMRGNNFLLTPTKFNITVGKPIVVNSSEWTEVTRLHTIARTFIAENCGEMMIDMLMAGPIS